MVNLYFIRLPHGEDLPPPEYQTELAAGFDLLAAISKDDTLTIPPLRRALVPTGIALQLPPSFEGQVRPRSGLAHRHGVTVLNAPGTIDADYRGEIQVLLVNLGDADFEIRRGDRIAQLVLCRIEQARLLHTPIMTETKRGKGGFGSTGV